MQLHGELEVHDNVVFEANFASFWGGAVSLPLEIGCHVAVGVSGDTFAKGRFNSVRRLMGISEALNRIIVLPQFHWAHNLMRQ